MKSYFGRIGAAKQAADKKASSAYPCQLKTIWSDVWRGWMGGRKPPIFHPLYGGSQILNLKKASALHGRALKHFCTWADDQARALQRLLGATDKLKWN